MNTTIKSCLTAEQSAALIAKGISADKASGHGERIYKTVELQNGSIKRVFNNYVPIFTLADLFAIMPEEIEFDGRMYGLNMWYNHIRKMWVVAYNNADINNPDGFLYSKGRCMLIDTLYTLLFWVIDRGYIDLTK